MLDEQELPRWQQVLHRAYAAGHYEDSATVQAARLLAAYTLLEAAADLLRGSGAAPGEDADDPWHH